MNFELSEEHKMIRDAAREFAQELKAGAIERDEEAKFPTDFVKQMAELGFMGIMTPEAYGGAGMDTLAYVIVLEEIAKIDASAAVIVSAHNSLVLYGLNAFGTEVPKQKYLVPLAQAQKLGAFALSVPEAGSDASSQLTTAADKGDHYLPNGTTHWTTNGGHADI